MERARARGRPEAPRSGAPPTYRGWLYTVGGASGGGLGGLPTGRCTAPPSGAVMRG